jgi:uncharacterized repeat protein (TIGR03803 family)
LPQRKGLMLKPAWLKRIVALIFVQVGTAAPPPEAVFKTLVRFGSTNSGHPWDTLAQGADGSFYGTTYGVGGHRKGSLFKISPKGSFASLKKLPGHPVAGLILASDGNFYGATDRGGMNRNGSIFRMTPAGKVTTIYSFCHPVPTCPDGSNPDSNVVQGTDGNFYGNTLEHGANGNGTIFRITPAGRLTTSL